MTRERDDAMIGEHGFGRLGWRMGLALVASASGCITVRDGGAFVALYQRNTCPACGAVTSPPPPFERRSPLAGQAFIDATSRGGADRLAQHPPATTAPSATSSPTTMPTIEDDLDTLMDLLNSGPAR